VSDLAKPAVQPAKFQSMNSRMHLAVVYNRPTADGYHLLVPLLAAISPFHFGLGSTLCSTHLASELWLVLADAVLLHVSYLRPGAPGVASGAGLVGTLKEMGIKVCVYGCDAVGHMTAATPLLQFAYRARPQDFVTGPALRRRHMAWPEGKNETEKQPSKTPMASPATLTMLGTLLIMKSLHMCS